NDQRSSALKRPKREQARFPSRRTRRSLISRKTGPRFRQVMTRTPSWQKRRKARLTSQASSAATRTRKEADWQSKRTPKRKMLSGGRKPRHSLEDAFLLAHRRVWSCKSHPWPLPVGEPPTALFSPHIG